MPLMQFIYFIQNSQKVEVFKITSYKEQMAERIYVCKLNFSSLNIIKHYHH